VQGLAEGNADVFHRVVTVNMKVAFGMDIEVDQAVAGDLVEHVVKKTNAGVQPGLARAVQIDLDRDPGLGGVAGHLRRARGCGG